MNSIYKIASEHIGTHAELKFLHDSFTLRIFRWCPDWHIANSMENGLIDYFAVRGFVHPGIDNFSIFIHEESHLDQSNVLMLFLRILVVHLFSEILIQCLGASGVFGFKNWDISWREIHPPGRIMFQ